MAAYEQSTIGRFSRITHDICLALEEEKGTPLPPALRDAIACRVMELFENGVVDGDQLRLGIMADALWTDGLHRGAHTAEGIDQGVALAISLDATPRNPATQDSANCTA